MNAETQIAYALNQHQLCCEYLNIPQRYDVEGGTLLEALIALEKDRDEWKDEAELRSKESAAMKPTSSTSVTRQSRAICQAEPTNARSAARHGKWKSMRKANGSPLANTSHPVAVPSQSPPSSNHVRST